MLHTPKLPHELYTWYTPPHAPTAARASTGHVKKKKISSICYLELSDVVGGIVKVSTQPLAVGNARTPVEAKKPGNMG